MAENKGRPGGKATITKTRSRRAASKQRMEKSTDERGSERSRRQTTAVKPAGRGGASQRAGGPRHRGLDPGEDRNP